MSGSDGFLDTSIARHFLICRGALEGTAEDRREGRRVVSYCRVTAEERRTWPSLRGVRYVKTWWDRRIGDARAVPASEVPPET